MRYGDIMTDELELTSVVAISEVMEHLPDPHSLVKRLDVDPVKFVVASSPFLETEADHYEQHLWAWNLEGYKAMFEAAGFQVVKQTTAGVHQALLATRKEA